MTKGGYVDSSRRIRSLHHQQDEFDSSKFQTSSSRTGLLASLNKTPLSAPPIQAIPKKSKTYEEREATSSLSLATNHEQKRKDYDKHMKSIEVSFYQFSLYWISYMFLIELRKK